MFVDGDYDIILLAMNLHPIFVHFPIAILSLYAVFEMFIFGGIRRRASWFYVKLSLLLTGFLFSLLTLETGNEVAEHISYGSSIWPVVYAHSKWAHISVFLFGVLATVYFLIWIKDYPECHNVYSRIKNNRYLEKPWKILSFMVSGIYNSPAIWILAFLGLIAMIITGSLGASIVHGADGDPVVRLVYKIFGL